jgi:hypothetical protein
MTQKNLNLKAKGLYIDSNNLGSMPEGALSVADNIDIDDEDVISNRRGFKIYGNQFSVGSDRAKQLLTYQDRVLVHRGTTLQYDNVQLTITSLTSSGLTATAVTSDDHGLQSGQVATISGSDFPEYNGSFTITVTGSNSFTYTLPVLAVSPAQGTIKLESGTFTSYSEPITETRTGLRIKSAQLNGNLYLTTSVGIKKLDQVTGTITDSGVVAALDNLLEINFTSPSTFLQNNNSVAYRIVWGIKDENNNLLLSAPSERTVITNTTGSDKAVNITITIPDGITTNHFFQIYRSEQGTAAGENYNQVFEDNPSSGEITAGTLTRSDIVDDSLRENGAPLYTNGNQEGILQSNYQPPLALDITSYQNMMFYANTKTNQQLTFNLLGIADIADGDTITIDGIVYTYKTQIAEQVQIVTDTKANTNDGEYLDINSGEDVVQYRAYMDTTGGNLVVPPDGGRTLLRIDISGAVNAAQVATTVFNTLTSTSLFSGTPPGGSTITLDCTQKGYTTDGNIGNLGNAWTFTTTVQGVGEDASLGYVALSDSATPAQQIDETARSLVRVINRYASSTIYAYYISGEDDFPGKMLFKSRLLSDPEFTVTVTTGTGLSYNPNPENATVASDNEEIANRVYISKLQQPEAVPLLNYIDIGSRKFEIERIIGLRDGIFVFKKDGIFRISGSTPSDLSVSLIDNSTRIMAPDSAAVGNNQIYAISDQGIIKVSDTGVANISSNMERTLIMPLLNKEVYPSTPTATWGMFYETERKYLLFTVTNSSDTVATQCFTYNVFTQCWTRYPISKTCGIINLKDDKMYLGIPDQAYIERERKRFEYRDFADRELVKSINDIDVDNETIELNSATGVEAGDVITQLIYLTPARFNALLGKLDLDPTLVFNAYVNTYKVSEYSEIPQALIDVCAELDDPASGTTDKNYGTIPTGTSDPVTLQAEFNRVIYKLNNDTGVSQSNFSYSLSTNSREILITEVDIPNGILTLEYVTGLIPGPANIQKAIKSVVTWIPQHAGSPDILKHFREAQIIFNNYTIKSAQIAFKSDLQRNLETINITGAGVTAWGIAAWGEGLWGGDSIPNDFRTYIPTQKQRCRFLEPKYSHSNAYESYRLLGLSLIYESTSPRTNR